MFVSIAKGEFGVSQEFQKSEFESSAGPKGPSITGDSNKKG